MLDNITRIPGQVYTLYEKAKELLYITFIIKLI